MYKKITFLLSISFFSIDSGMKKIEFSCDIIMQHMLNLWAKIDIAHSIAVEDRHFLLTPIVEISCDIYKMFSCCIAYAPSYFSLKEAFEIKTMLAIIQQKHDVMLQGTQPANEGIIAHCLLQHAVGLWNNFYISLEAKENSNQ